MVDPADVIDIRDPDIDVEEIMQRIRQRIRERRAQAQARGLDYDRLTDGALDGGPDRHLSGDLYYDLHQARESAETIWVPLSVVGEQRYPRFLTPLLNRVRHAAHHLVLYYVNMLAGRQIVFNRAAVSAVSGLAEADEKTVERLLVLEQEVASLRERVAVLEKRQTPNDSTE